MAQQTLQRGIISALILCGGLLAAFCPQVAGADAPSTSAIIATPPQPAWAELSSEQREVLNPLADDWNQMENFRRKKWLGIAERYNRMTPDEQARLQRRMREWADLTPEQRRAIREKYKNIKQLPTAKKDVVKQKWQEYATLSDEERQKLKDLAPPVQKAWGLPLPTRKGPATHLPQPIPPGIHLAPRNQASAREHSRVPTLPGTVAAPAGFSLSEALSPKAARLITPTHFSSIQHR